MCCRFGAREVPVSGVIDRIARFVSPWLVERKQMNPLSPQSRREGVLRCSPTDYRHHGSKFVATGIESCEKPGELTVMADPFMNFDQRLEKAVERGQRQRDAESRERALKAMTEEECKNLHTQARLELSEHIEIGLRKLADYFPGFDYETLMSADGWGARIRRDDLAPGSAGTRGLVHYYSHIEMLVRPYSATRILELVARGAIRNKEVLSRSHFQQLTQLDVDIFREVVDQWILEYAEKFSARA